MKLTKCFLVDDDPIFCNGLVRLARDFGIALDTFYSPLEFEGVAMNKYSAGIVDIDLGPVQGPELKDYLGAISGDCPIMYISSMDQHRVMLSGLGLDQANFVSKSKGFRHILSEALRLIERTRGQAECLDEMHWKFKQKGIILIDDDVSFRDLVKAYATAAKIPIDCYASLSEMGSFAVIGEYDIAIVDYFLEGMKGDEIAEYFAVFFPGRPVIVISADENVSCKLEKWPTCIKAFLPKSIGVAAILHKIWEICQVTNNELVGNRPFTVGSIFRTAEASP